MFPGMHGGFFIFFLCFYVPKKTPLFYQFTVQKNLEKRNPHVNP